MGIVLQESATSLTSMTRLQIIVQSMHERKVEMAKRVEGFIGLPGGFGTFEEVFLRSIIISYRNWLDIP